MTETASEGNQKDMDQTLGQYNYIWHVLQILK